MALTRHTLHCALAFAATTLLAACGPAAGRGKSGGQHRARTRKTGQRAQYGVGDETSGERTAFDEEPSGDAGSGEAQEASGPRATASNGTAIPRSSASRSADEVERYIEYCWGVHLPQIGCQRLGFLEGKG